MARHDRAYGRHHSTRAKGKGHKGRGVMRQRRLDSGMDKVTFEAMIARLGIRSR